MTSKPITKAWKDAYREIMRARIHHPSQVDAMIRKHMPKLGPSGVARIREMVENEYQDFPGRTEIPDEEEA